MVKWYLLWVLMVLLLFQWKLLRVKKIERIPYRIHHLTPEERYLLTTLEGGDNSWLSGWQYRKSHTLIGATGAGIDYQKKITVIFSADVLDKVGEFGGYEGSNPIIDVGAGGTWDEKIREIGNVLYEPTDSGKEYKTWFSANEGAYNGYDVEIGYAYSSDGISWTKVQCNFDHAEDPYIIKVGATYYMYYESKGAGNVSLNISRAYSSDGVTWTNEGSILEEVGGTWESDDVSSPVVWIENSTWYMLYEGRETAGQRGSIGLATSNDGLSWSKDGGNPVFEPGDTTWASKIASDDIIKVSGTYYFFYHGHDGSTWRCGKATSTNLTSWTDAGESPLTTDGGGVLSDIMIYYDSVNSTYISHYTTSDTSGIYRGYPNTVSLGGHCETDFGDVRFTDDDGITELDYWLEEKVDSDYAIFWVEVTDDLDSNQTIYLYYGKGGASTTSNLENLGGDNFNDNSRDTGLWDEYEVINGTVDETNQRLEITCPVKNDGAGYVTKVVRTLNYVDIRVLADNSNVSELVIWISLTKVTNSNVWLEDDWYRILLRKTDSQCYVQKRVGGGGITTLYEDTLDDSQNILRIEIDNGNITFFEGDTKRASESWALGSRDCYIYIAGSASTDDFGTDWMDDFWIRGYVSPEPADGVWGNEESAPRGGRASLLIPLISILCRVKSLFR